MRGIGPNRAAVELHNSTLHAKAPDSGALNRPGHMVRGVRPKLEWQEIKVYG